MIIIDELSYSFHIGNDKNKSKKSRQTMKNKNVKDTQFNNNAIQNAQALSKVDKHNLRKYDNNKKVIELIYGTNSLYEDVKKLYIDEFDKSRIEYNEKQKRNDRKIEDYFYHISNNDKNDLACEIIIELGDMKFWNDKDEEFKKKMTQVFEEQIQDLEKVVPSFKVANAVVHYDEASPHLHIVGVPIKKGNKNGMSKQVSKSTIFTKESLREIQDTMRIYCINSFNKVYNSNKSLKTKLKGRNKDIQTKNMEKEYVYLKELADRNRERLDKVNKQTETTLLKSKQVKEIIDNLKPTKITKNNYLINDNEIKILNEYIDNVNVNVSDIKNVDDLTTLMENFEHDLKNHDIEVNELQLKVNEQSERIKTLEKQNISKQNKIAEQRKEITSLEKEITKLEKIILAWQHLWQRIRDFFQDKLFSSKKEDKIYEQVINDMIEEDIFNNEDIEYIENGFIQKEKDDLELY